MIKKIVISPSNKKALIFLEELNRKKEAMRKKIEKRLNERKSTSKS
jgi:hypothetical protein